MTVEDAFLTGIVIPSFGQKTQISSEQFVSSKKKLEMFDPHGSIDRIRVNAKTILGFSLFPMGTIEISLTQSHDKRYWLTYSLISIRRCYYATCQILTIIMTVNVFFGFSSLFDFVQVIIILWAAGHLGNLGTSPAVMHKL